MKKHLLHLFILIVFISIVQKQSLAQLNPITNSTTPPATNMSVGVNTIDKTNTNGIACTPNTFFALDNSTGEIHEVLITGTTTTVQSVVLTNARSNLAFCDNLNGGSFSPTLYSSDLNNIPSYYNGSSWINISSPTPSLFNPAGSGSNLFYMSISGTTRNIIKYDGSNFTTIYSCTSPQILAVADLAADNIGNVYFIIGHNISSSMTDSLLIISPNGNRVASFPFVINTYYAYGAFLLNDIYYIGFGPNPQSPNMPNTLLPISFATGYPVTGSIISVPSGTNYSDLASCDPGLPLGLNNEHLSRDLNFYPNPFMSQTTLKFNKEQTLSTARIKDVFGKEIRTISFSGKELIIEKGEMTAGIYFIEISNINKIMLNKKIIVQ